MSKQLTISPVLCRDNKLPPLRLQGAQLLITLLIIEVPPFPWFYCLVCCSVTSYSHRNAFSCRDISSPWLCAACHHVYYSPATWQLCYCHLHWLFHRLESVASSSISPGHTDSIIDLLIGPSLLTEKTKDDLEENLQAWRRLYIFAVKIKKESVDSLSRCGCDKYLDMLLFVCICALSLIWLSSSALHSTINA